MIKTERQKRLIDILSSNQMISILNLSEKLSSSKMTIIITDDKTTEAIVEQIRGINIEVIVV